MWLAGQGLQPQQASDLALRSYSFQLATTEMLRAPGETGRRDYTFPKMVFGFNPQLGGVCYQ